MGSKTTNTTVNKPPEFVKPPENPYYTEAAKALDNVDYTTPVLQSFGQAENLIKEGDNSIFGANTSAEVRGKVINSKLLKNTFDKGTAMSQAKAQEDNARFSGKMSLGGATAPVMYSPGGTSTQSTPFSAGSLIAPIIGGGMAALTGGMSSGGALA
ncbi:MAG TPA: hypothetical protein VNI84_14255 [Pyrinomonadaceae bacterium]|nr:hypothetical protein [Pyrinomonadaceae bacterium]